MREENFTTVLSKISKGEECLTYKYPSPSVQGLNEVFVVSLNLAVSQCHYVVLAARCVVLSTLRQSSVRITPRTIKQ